MGSSGVRAGLLVEPDLADLDHRGDVGVVGDVALENIRVGQKSVGECLNRLAGKGADGREGRQLVGRSTKHSDFNRNSLDRGAE